MRVLSQLELARCSKAELQTLLNAILAELPCIDGDDAIRAAHANLANIRKALARPGFRPG